jgi:hypothetical protein
MHKSVLTLVLAALIAMLSGCGTLDAMSASEQQPIVIILD